MIFFKIRRIVWLFAFVLLVLAFQRTHATVALNHGRGGPHKFGWVNTGDRHAARRALVSEKAYQEKLAKDLKVKKLPKTTTVVVKNEGGNRYEHSY